MWHEVPCRKDICTSENKHLKSSSLLSVTNTGFTLWWFLWGRKKKKWVLFHIPWGIQDTCMESLNLAWCIGGLSPSSALAGTQVPCAISDTCMGIMLHQSKLIDWQRSKFCPSKRTLCYTPRNGYTCIFFLWISSMLLIINPEDPPAESQCQREDPCSLRSFMGASLFSSEALNRVSATRHSVPIYVKPDFRSDLPSRQSFVPGGDV